MPQILFRVNADAGRPATRDRRGDVIAHVPNTHVWSSFEQTHPDWRIFTGVNLSALELEAYLETDLNNGRRRKGRIALAHADWPPHVRTYIQDDARIAPTKNLNPTLNGILVTAFEFWT